MLHSSPHHAKALEGSRYGDSWLKQHLWRHCCRESDTVSIHFQRQKGRMERCSQRNWRLKHSMVHCCDDFSFTTCIIYLYNISLAFSQENTIPDKKFPFCPVIQIASLTPTNASFFTLFSRFFNWDSFPLN